MTGSRTAAEPLVVGGRKRVRLTKGYFGIKFRSNRFSKRIKGSAIVLLKRARVQRMDRLFIVQDKMMHKQQKWFRDD